MPRARFQIIIRRIVAGLGLCLGTARMLGAADGPPPAPSSFVQDDARLFDEASLEKMSRALAETQRATGVSVYVATSSYLENVGNRNYPHQLLERWLPDKPGVILTYNRGNGQPGVVASPELWRRHPADEIARVLADAGRILGQPGAGPEHRIQEAVTLLIERIRTLDANRRDTHAPFTSADQRLAIPVAAAIALAGLTVWLVSFVRRRNTAALGGPYLFPEASVNARLGAQFGGGIGESSAPRRD